jgi:hypothetical protein
MAKPKPTPMPYWEKEEKSRPKMDWRNAPDSAAVATKRRAEAKKAAAKKLAEKKKSKMKSGMIPASPTN